MACTGSLAIRKPRIPYEHLGRVTAVLLDRAAAGRLTMQAGHRNNPTARG